MSRSLSTLLDVRAHAKIHKNTKVSMHSRKRLRRVIKRGQRQTVIQEALQELAIIDPAPLQVFSSGPGEPADLPHTLHVYHQRAA